MTAKKSYTPEQLERMNAGLPAKQRFSETFARTIHQYSSATGLPLRKRGTQNPDPRYSAWAPINNATSRAPYEGPELRRLCVRPGAYDAIDAPSLRNGQRVAPQAPFCSP